MCALGQSEVVGQGVPQFRILSVSMDRLKLVSFNLCPFVQRSVITLLEKGADFEIEYIDLSNKPDWFQRMSPLGKVPVLQVNDVVLFESAVINEYIDETLGERRFLPQDPLARARERAWIEVCSQATAETFALMSATDESTGIRCANKVRQLLERFEENVGGLFFGGGEFGLVDAAAAPFLQRLQWISEIAPSLDLFSGMPKLAAWNSALSGRDSLKGSVIPDMRSIFIEYLKGRGSPTRSAACSWLGSMA